MPAVPRARYRTKLGPSDLTFHQLDMASIASFSRAAFLGLTCVRSQSFLPFFSSLKYKLLYTRFQVDSSTKFGQTIFFYQIRITFFFVMIKKRIREMKRTWNPIKNEELQYIYLPIQSIWPNVERTPITGVLKGKIRSGDICRRVNFRFGIYIQI